MAALSLTGGDVAARERGVGAAWRPSLAARGVKLLRIQKESAMPKSSRTTAHIHDYGPVEERREDFADTMIQFLTMRQAAK